MCACPNNMIPVPPLAPWPIANLHLSWYVQPKPSSDESTDFLDELESVNLECSVSVGLEMSKL